MEEKFQQILDLFLVMGIVSMPVITICLVSIAVDLSIMKNRR
ncbi:hypothetical protein [Bacillus mesophilum]|nr:hypothetical protein [Bacillus mesophilum]